MSTGHETIFDFTQAVRMVVVGERLTGFTVAEELRRRYRSATIVSCETYLSAIDELTREPAGVVIACVDPSYVQLENAIAGLRQAIGPDARLLLCCTAEDEPVARRLVAAGASDYILYPPLPEELHEALAPALPAESIDISAGRPAGNEMRHELTLLAGVLSALEAGPAELLGRMAELIRTALHATGAVVVVEGTAASAGEQVGRPVLSAPLTREQRTVGQISVGAPADRPYQAGDAEHLTHLARVCGYVLEAAARTRRWKELAVTDEVSGLPNRRYLYEALDRTLRDAGAKRQPVTLLLFDVDDFKAFNDRYGHAAGDEIIRVVGELFRKHSREHDVVTRFGGDEFAVVFWSPEGPRVPGSQHPQCALEVLERFSAALADVRFPRWGERVEARLTISGGLATFPWDASTGEELIRRADEALHEAKRAGKNRVFIVGRSEVQGT